MPAKYVRPYSKGQKNDFRDASEVTPKFVSPSDPAAQWTGPAFFAHADNYLVDVKFGIIMDVTASRAIRQAEVGAAKTMIERTEARFGIKPARLAADTAYGSAPTLHWLVDDKQIVPHIPVIDKSKRDDGTFSREDFTFDKERDILRSTLPKARCEAPDAAPVTILQRCMLALDAEQHAGDDNAEAHADRPIDQLPEEPDDGEEKEIRLQ